MSEVIDRASEQKKRWGEEGNRDRSENEGKKGRTMEIVLAKEERIIEGQRKGEKERRNERRIAEKEKQRNHALSHSNARFLWIEGRA